MIKFDRWPIAFKQKQQRWKWLKDVCMYMDIHTYKQEHAHNLIKII